MRTRDRLLSRVLTVTLPLLVWGVHFFFCYAWAAVACERGAGATLALAAASVLAAAVSAVLLARALRRVCARGQGGAALHDWAALAIAALALVAIAWSCVPLLMVDLCAGPGFI
ncbi:hypothetical protein ASF61_07555 [Duganella sp. Leaf126]|nr:hypothetical protein ASF61_07555 [Duganella sp. Leaf126]